MSNKPVFCRIRDIKAMPAVEMLRRGMIYRKMPDGEMRQQNYKPGLGFALKTHIRAFPYHRYFIKTSG